MQIHLLTFISNGSGLSRTVNKHRQTNSYGEKCSLPLMKAVPDFRQYNPLNKDEA